MVSHAKTLMQNRQTLKALAKTTPILLEPVIKRKKNLFSDRAQKKIFKKLIFLLILSNIEQNPPMFSFFPYYNTNIMK